jgi:hypothetical protein
MPVKGPRHDFSPFGLSGAPQEAGVFALWDGEELIYVGRTLGRYATIKSVLTDHCLGDYGTCTQRATHYSAEVSLDGGRRERELLHEFGEMYGRLPRCQTQGGA